MTAFRIVDGDNVRVKKILGEMEKLPEIGYKILNRSEVGISRPLRKPRPLDFPKILVSFPAFQPKRIVLDTFRKAIQKYWKLSKLSGFPKKYYF